MTVSYNHQVATSKPYLILKLLARWKGSVWKAVSLELGIWLLAYYIIFCIYRYWMGDYSRKKFEDFIRFFQGSMSYIPLDFMLSFFVTIIVNRWSTIFQNLGMIDNIALFASNYIKGDDDRGRNLRRNVVRYCCLSQAMVFRDLNMQVRRRFPTFEALVAAGFMMEHELELFHDVQNRYAKYWVPLNWALTLINNAKKEGRVDSDVNEFAIAQEIRNFRTNLQVVWQHDWISIPILYPQIVFTATHIYFLLALFARQFIVTADQKPGEVDIHFPLMTVFQFIFYVGWMKVAMALLNPMGEDDDDYDCNFLLDRNLTIALGCQDCHRDPPEMKPDAFWDMQQAQPLYSLQSAIKRLNFFMGSAALQEKAEGGLKKSEEIQMVPHPMNERYMNRHEEERLRRRGVTIGKLELASSEDQDWARENDGKGGLFDEALELLGHLRHSRSNTQTMDMLSTGLENIRRMTGASFGSRSRVNSATSMEQGLSVNGGVQRRENEENEQSRARAMSDRPPKINIARASIDFGDKEAQF